MCTVTDAPPAHDPVLAALLERCRADHHRWINGDASGYQLPDDGTILGAVGGVGRGGAATAGIQQAVASQWQEGRGEVELVNGGVSGDVAWLAMVERAEVRFDDAVGAGSGPHRWDLRVTEVFRREPDGRWERLHRHADPLVDLRPLALVVDVAESR